MKNKKYLRSVNGRFRKYPTVNPILALIFFWCLMSVYGAIIAN